MHIMQAVVGCQKRSTKSLSRSRHPIVGEAIESGPEGNSMGGATPQHVMLRRVEPVFLSATCVSRRARLAIARSDPPIGHGTALLRVLAAFMRSLGRPSADNVQTRST